MGERTIAAVSALKLLRAAGGEGLDLSKLPRFEMPDGLDALERRIPEAEVTALWEAVMRLADDPSFPIRATRWLTTREFDAIGLACMTRATLREALSQMIRFSRIWTDSCRWTVTDHGDATTLVFDAEEAHTLGKRCAIEFLMAEMINAGRQLSGVHYSPLRVHFRHAAPRDTSAHQAFFEAPIVWSANKTALEVTKASLDLPLLKADAGLAAFFDRHLEEMAARHVNDDALRSKLRAALAEELRRGLPTVDAIAPRLAMSARTLRRRLQEEGTSFQDVLDEVRCESAKRYLEQQSLAVGEVAFLLGFSEPSAFHRAFKRWTGTTPLAHRRGLTAA